MRRSRRILLAALAAATLAAAALIVVVATSRDALAQTSLLGLKNSLVQFALEQISTPDEFEITAEGVEEPDDGATDLVGVAIADGEGVWLTIERLSIAWNASRILLGELEIARLAATDVRVLRQPSAAGVDIEVKEDSALAATDDDPFDFPRSPITLRVDEMRLDGVFLAEGVLSPNAMSFDALGSARDEGDEQAATLSLTRTDAIAGAIALDYLRDFAADTLTLRLDAAEDAGGLVAALADLPADSASRLTLSADGPLTAWRLDLSAASDGVFEATGSATLSNAERLSATAALQVVPGEALSATVRQALSPAARLDIRVAETEGGLVRIEEAAVSAADLDLSASGTYARESGEMDVAVDLDARAGLAELVDGLAFERIGFDGAFRGAPEDATAVGTLSVLGVTADAGDVGRAELEATIRLLGETIAVDAAGDALGVRIDRLDPETVGPARLEARIAYAGDRAEIERAELRSALLTASVTGDVDLGAETAAVDYAADAADLAPIAAAYDANAEGAFRLSGRLEGPLAALRLAGSARLEDMMLDGEPLGGVTLEHDVAIGDAIEGRAKATADGSRFGPARVETSFALRSETLSLPDLQAAALGATATGAATVDLSTSLVDGALEIAAPDLATFSDAAGEPLGGAATVSARLSPADGRQNGAVDIDVASFSGFGATAATIDARLSGRDLLAEAPLLTLDLDAATAETGGLTLDAASLAMEGPLTALNAIAEATGAIGEEPFAVASTAAIDAEARQATVATLALDLREERIALAQPMAIAAAEDATTIAPIALAFPGGATDGDLALYADGARGALRIDVDQLAALTAFLDGPKASGTLSADARFDTRAASAGATGVVRLRELAFDEAVSADGAVAATVDLGWDGREAMGEMIVEGGFGDPATARFSHPLRPSGGVAPEIPPGAEIDGRLDWSGDVGALWAFVPAADHLLDGRLDVALTIGGPFDAPTVAGSARLENGRYENLDVGTVLTELEAETRLADDGGVVLDARAKDGGDGAVAASLRLLDGAIDAALTSTEAILVRRDDVVAELSLDLAVDGPVDAPTASGVIEIDRAEIRLVSATPPSVADLGDVRIKGAPPPEPQDDPSGRIALDLRAVAEDDVFVRGRGLESEWRVDLAIGGVAGAPRVTGSIDKVRGDLSLLGRPFELDRGRIAFIGADPPDPTIDVALFSERDGFRGGIVVGGSALAPDIGFASTPAAPEEDVLPRVLFGRSKQSLSGVEALQLANGLRTLLDGSSGVIDDIRGAAALDVLQIGERDGKANVQLGRDVADGVFVGVTQPIDGSTPSVNVEVDVFDNVTVDSEVGADGASSLGLNWRMDF